MSVELACECDDLPAHSHVYHHEPIRRQGRVVGMNSRLDPFDIRVWVDWRAVARALSQQTASTEAVPDAR